MARPYEEWDEYWLSRLQIYQTALADSQPTLDGSTGAVDRLFLDLISDQRERLVPLFSAYAAENPRGAFRLSEACGVDLVKDAPELLVLECGNPPFLDLCIDVAGSPGANISEWAAIFVAAGFRSSLVARTLSNREVPPAWRGSTADLVRTENWDNVTGRRKPVPSVYSFSLSLIRHELQSGSVVAFNSVRPLNTPGPPRFLTRDWMFFVAILILFAGTCAVIIFAVTVDLKPWTRIVTVLGSYTYLVTFFNTCNGHLSSPILFSLAGQSCQS